MRGLHVVPSSRAALSPACRLLAVCDRIRSIVMWLTGLATEPKIGKTSAAASPASLQRQQQQQQQRSQYAHAHHQNRRSVNVSHGRMADRNTHATKENRRRNIKSTHTFGLARRDANLHPNHHPPERTERDPTRAEPSRAHDVARRTTHDARHRQEAQFGHRPVLFRQPVSHRQHTRAYALTTKFAVRVGSPHTHSNQLEPVGYR